MEKHGASTQNITLLARTGIASVGTDRACVFTSSDRFDMLLKKGQLTDRSLPARVCFSPARAC